IFEQLAEFDDTRITFAGVGDPLLHDDVLNIISAAKDAGISAIHLETDLIAPAEQIERLVELAVDVVSVHLPAMQITTYAKIMGVDRLAEVIENIKRFILHRQLHRRGVPLLVPTF